MLIDEEIERHCDSDCLHSKACDADYGEQLVDLEERRKELEKYTVPSCGVTFTLGYRTDVVCQLEAGHKGRHAGKYTRGPAAANHTELPYRKA